jgi:hypothetical protein
MDLVVHTIPVRGDWVTSEVYFHGGGKGDGGGSYPKILKRLVGLRNEKINSVPDFEEQYARALLDLAAAPTGQPGIPQRLRELAGAVYGDANVNDFLSNPKWSDTSNKVGNFLHDAAALTVLQVPVEGKRNPAALVTNLANWDMVAAGKLSFEDALGYLNVMGPVGSVQVGQESLGHSNPAAQVLDDLGQRVAEMEMRQRQILALYAVTTRQVRIAEDATGVAALNAYFAQGDPRDVIQTMMASLVKELGW